MSLTVLLLAVATTAAALGVTESARVPVICCGVLAALLALSLTAEVLRGHRAQEHLARAHIQEKAALERRVAEYDAETYRMANEVMPVALELTLRGHRATVTENKVLAAQRFANLPTPQRHMLRVFLDAIDEGENVRSGIRFAFISTTRRIQAIAHTLAAELREMEEDHGRNPEVFDDLLRIDHCNSLITRYADNLATIGGGRPSRQWAEPVPLFSLLRGSMSRINDFPRIELENIPDIPIKGTMVEPILQAAAELMDNGARYSPPAAKVHVTALRVRAGIAISVEDAGAPFDEELQQRAMRVFAHSATGRDLGEYKGEPRTGMSVLGRLCRLYRMTLELRSSAYGGLRAILMVPEHMIEGIDYVAPGRAHGIGATAVPRYDENGELIKERRRKGKPEGRRLAGPPLRDADGEPIREAEMPTFTERTAEGLPQRRRRSEHVFAPQDASEIDPFAPAQRSPWEKKTAPDPFGRDEPEPEQQLPGLALEAFLAGVNGTEQSERQPGTAGRSEVGRDDIDEGDHR
ncbi:ATP-binding protein [Streptomyces sp. NPDC049954]|uniref:ATP-binding protein n=1 Tax=Streptomyces sp. NPDC049954 TaxID=3155779 RepID=UPI00341F759F